MELLEKANITADITNQNYLVQIKSPHHRLLADEPLEKGGQDLGMAPFELLASSLVACTLITLKMYADFKQIPLEKAEVQVKFLADEKNTEAKFVREIQLIGELDAETQERLLRVANSCPVHKLLSKANVIDTVLI